MTPIQSANVISKLKATKPYPSHFRFGGSNSGVRDVVSFLANRFLRRWFSSVDRKWPPGTLLVNRPAIFSRAEFTAL